MVKNKALKFLIVLMILVFIGMVALPASFFADQGIASFYKIMFGIAWFFMGIVTEVSMIGYFVHNIEK